jgi:uncharacterized delta-60 repeat protein
MSIISKSVGAGLAIVRPPLAAAAALLASVFLTQAQSPAQTRPAALSGELMASVQAQKKTLAGELASLGVSQDVSQPGTFTFAATNFLVNEAATVAIITVLRTNGNAGSVSVWYFTVGDTATPGLDYFSSQGELTFAEGETEKSFAIWLINDLLAEPTETLLLVLTSATGGATFPDGAERATATLSIINDDDVSVPPPTITQQPVSQTNSPGGTVSFNVSANGMPPLSYQWRIDGSPIPGATNATLVLNNVQRTDAGRYTVLVSGPSGWIVSQEADLIVPAAPNSPGSVDVDFAGSLVGEGTVQVIVEQADGKLLVGGAFTNVNGLPCSGLARLLTDGERDWDFNVNLEGDPPSVIAIALQSDGGIVIGGSFTAVNGVSRDRVARLYPDGTVDPSFDLPVGLFDQVEGIAVQSGDRALVLGYRYAAGSPVGVLVRCNADGSLDSSFSVGTDGGIATILVQPDDKIMIAGDFSAIDGRHCASPARLQANGSLDPSLDSGIGTSGVLHLALQADGRMLLGGFFDYVNGWPQPKLARLSSEGSADLSFTPQVHGTPAAIAVEPSGKILVSGLDLVNSVRFSGIARLNPDGSPDISFAAGAGPRGSVSAICRQSDGKLVLGGVFTDFDFFPCNGIVRLNGDSPAFACRLSIEVSQGTGQPQLTLAGAIGSKLQVEATSDFQTWAPLMTVTNTLGRIEVFDPTANGSPQRFYRARLVE